MDFGTIETRSRGKYRARYMYRGKRYTAPHTFKTKRLAAAWLADEEKLIQFGEWSPPELRAAGGAGEENAAPTVAEWLDNFHDSLATQLQPIRESTLQQYRRVTLNRITAPLPPGDVIDDIMRLRSLKITEVTPNDVHLWWEAINRAYDTKTANQHAYKRLKAAFARAVERELIAKNPVGIKSAGIRVKPDEKYLPTDEELNLILDAMPARYKVLTSLTLFHGLRIGEAIGLERRHVKINGGRVSVVVEQNAQRLTENVNGKNHTYLNWQPPKTQAGYREVPIMPAHAHLFVEHLQQFPPVDCIVRFDDKTKTIQPLTTTSAGGTVMDTSFRSRLNTAELRAGVTTDIDPHCGRNWLITRLAEQGAHLKEIGKLLGQNDLDTIIQVYMKVRAGRTDTLMEKVSNSLAS